MAKLAQRQVDEMDRLTLAIASGQGIAFGGKPAYDAWQKSRGRAPSGRSADAQKATLARLAQWNLMGGERLPIREH